MDKTSYEADLKKNDSKITYLTIELQQIKDCYMQANDNN